MAEYSANLLRVNLSTGKVSKEPIARQDVRDLIGGRGFAIKYLYNELAPNIDPLSEYNKLILATGVLAGTGAQGASRWLACTKSPLTGCYARASGGADFGAWLKFAGYDFIIIEGKADEPVYLSVTSDSCRIEDARELWGMETGPTQEWLSNRHGKDSRTACIGPAGEKLVKYAAIVSAKRTASRCGVGAVMGSKKLKAIVVNARRNINLHDPEAFNKLVKEQIEILLASKGFQEHKETGTTDGSISRNSIGVFPVRNFRYGQQVNYRNFCGAEYKKLRVGDFGCYSCSARCGKVHTVTEGPYTGAHSEGPEYESMWAFTGTIDSDNVAATIAADELCDNLGLDTISAGNTIGFAYELYEKGIITKADTDGLELTYGNHAAMVALIKKIANREGFGDLLAEGSLRVARHIGKGSEYYAMQVKGLELPAYEPRGLKATGFGYATSTIGGAHGNGTLAFQEWGMPVPRAVDRFAEEGKADIVIYNQNRSALNETGIICSFFNSFGNWVGPLFGKMLAAATGLEELADREYLSKVGDRIVNLDKAFNVRDGFNRSHDTLPQRVQTEPLHTREAQGEGQMVRNLDKFLDEYYQLRGWSQQGIPTAQKLNGLGLSYIVKDIEKFNQ